MKPESMQLFMIPINKKNHGDASQMCPIVSDHIRSSQLVLFNKINAK